MKKNTISMTYCHTKNNRTLLVKVSYLLFRKYVLKDHILQEAIEKAEDHDFSMVNELLTVALAPFDEHHELEHLCNPTPIKSKISNLAVHHRLTMRKKNINIHNLSDTIK